MEKDLFFTFNYGGVKSTMDHLTRVAFDDLFTITDNDLATAIHCKNTISMKHSMKHFSVGHSIKPPSPSHAQLTRVASGVRDRPA